MLETTDLGECAQTLLHMLHERGWKAMVMALQADANLHLAIHIIDHPAAPLIDHLCHHRAPVDMHTAPWMREQCNTTMV